MEGCLVGGFILVVLVIAAIANRSGSRGSSSHQLPDPDEVLPNGYRRSDYHSYGLTDTDIETWGMDQPSAPEPPMAGYAILDMQDGKLDGKFDGDHTPWGS